MAAFTIDTTKERLADLHKQLGYIRCWIDGFEAAGKRGPHTSDALRQVQLLLGDAKLSTAKSTIDKTSE